MSVLSRVNETNQIESDRLLNLLIQEWRRPSEEADAEPVIIEEKPQNQARTNHVYVIWSEWKGLTGLERSKIIIQAYAKYRGQDLANDITLAMGLTREEAEKIGLVSQAD